MLHLRTGRTTARLAMLAVSSAAACSGSEDEQGDGSLFGSSGAAGFQAAAGFAGAAGAAIAGASGAPPSGAGGLPTPTGSGGSFAGSPAVATGGTVPVGTGGAFGMGGFAAGGFGSPGSGGQMPGSGGTTGSGGGAAGSPPAATFGEVYAIIEENCGGGFFGCHVDGESGDLPMPDAATAHRNLVGVASSECPGETRVVAGNADGSLLVKALEGTACVDRMPDGEPALSSEQIGVIRAWINAGASSN